MEATLAADQQQYERADTLLETAFRRVAGGQVAVPNTLQRALFPRLLSRDSGLLVPTAPGAGRLEAVFVPSLTRWPLSEMPPRLFIVAPDRAVLDDYEYRLIPYVRSLAASDGVPRTVYMTNDPMSPACRNYMPDGRTEPQECAHPLDSEIDLFVLRMSEFRALFFSDGIVKGLPEATMPQEMDDASPRSDMLYFDDAPEYSPEQFGSFLRLIEFLFAEDLDIVVGSTTLPRAAIEQLSFLETLYVPEANDEPIRTIQSIDRKRWTPPAIAAAIEDAQSAVLIAETDDEANGLASSIYEATGAPPTLYLASMPADDRLSVYGGLRTAEREGRRYVCIADPAVAEAVDLSADLVVTGVCSPESLVRRAGRCNRRREFASGRILVITEEAEKSAKRLSKYESAYTSMIRDLSEPVPFSGAAWIAFIGA